MGLKPGVSRDALREAIEANRAEELLNWINIYPGEMIYVAGGTVHTLGPGSILVETQQQSDCTYRLYDYGRPRELHLEEGLAAVKKKVASGKVVRRGPAAIAQTKNKLAPRFARHTLWWTTMNSTNRRRSELAMTRGRIRCRFWWCAKVAELSKRPAWSRSPWLRAMPRSFRSKRGEFRSPPAMECQFFESVCARSPAA